MISFDKVKNTYNKKNALNAVSFDIKKGEFVALVGNNGSGKTTLINALCNLIKLDGGGIFYNGNLLTKKYTSYKKDIGVILSEHYFVEEFNTIEYLKFYSKFQGVNNMHIKKRIAYEAIANVYISSIICQLLNT